MNLSLRRLLLAALEYSHLILFALVFLGFSLTSSRFFTGDNLVNILIQSSSMAIVAMGMTFVLLTAGIDLSVGSIMFVSAVIAGKMVLAGYPMALAFAVILSIGIVYGALNALLITRLHVIPFIVTLATLYIGRGFGLWISETRVMNLPDRLQQLGTGWVAGLPVPIWIFLLVLLISYLTLSWTTFGRRIYAIGNDPEAAKKAGINTAGLLFSVYVISGFLAALGGLVSVAQLGSVAPKFGEQREFAAIAAAVLGGTSLFGGRGNVFGTVLGAILIQTVENGLVIMNANVYIYPLVTSSIIFLAVMIDSMRNLHLTKLRRKKIRIEHEA